MGRRLRKSKFKRRFRRQKISKRFNFNRYLKSVGKPEIKFIGAIHNVTIAGGITESRPLNVATITQGVGQAQFIGRFIRARYLKLKLMLSQQEGDANIGNNFFTKLRVSILGPRVDQAVFNAHRDAVGNLGQWDPAIVNVIYDDYVYLTKPATNNIQAKPYLKLNKTIRWPRKIQLGDNGAFMEFQDNCMIVINSTSNNNSGVHLYGHVRLTYKDN